MAIFDDHQPCPPLGRWLLPSWQGRSAASWVAPVANWRPPRGLLRLLDRHDVPAWSDATSPGSLDVLVVLSPLSDAVPCVEAAPWDALRPGGTLAELSSVPRRRPGDWLRPWVRADRLRDAAAMRVRQWLDRGAFGPEQWVAIEPSDVIVTLVRRSV